jgi:hypothetical protein
LGLRISEWFGEAEREAPINTSPRFGERSRHFDAGEGSFLTASPTGKAQLQNLRVGLVPQLSNGVS